MIADRKRKKYLEETAAKLEAANKKQKKYQEEARIKNIFTCDTDNEAAEMLNFKQKSLFIFQVSFFP